MTYTLGLDLGTTYTAAAIWRAGSTEMVGLGTHGSVIPSIVHLRDDGQLLTGESAVRRSLSQPANSAREFKRRLGDSTPIVLGSTPYDPAALMKALLRDVVATVVEREGEAPSRVAIAHPANWGEFKIDLLRQAAIACGLGTVEMVSEPIAAAVDYASKERVAVGEAVAVYDLGGGTFDVAVLRRTADGFVPLGQPEGLERLGGIDFDHAVMSHVERSIEDQLATLDRTDPEVKAGLARLRQECIAAKEGLSEDGEVTVPVALPGVWADVRITRPEFEAMIAPTLTEPLRAFNRALDSAGVTIDTIHAVLLVGGSSRVPLVAETVAGALQRKIAVDTHPKHAVALGAARVAAATLNADTASAATLTVELPVKPPAPATDYVATAMATAPVAPAAPESGSPSESESQFVPPAATTAVGTTVAETRTRVVWLVAAAIAIAAAVVAGVIALVPSTSATQVADEPVEATPTQVADEPVEATPIPVPTTPTVGLGLAVTTATPAGAGLDEAEPTVSRPRPTAQVVAPTSVPRPPTPTAIPTPAGPTCRSQSGLCAFITNLRVEGNRYIADYATIGFDPLVVGEDAGARPGDHHVHFFFDTTSALNAGTNGNPPGSWALWSLQRGGGRFVFDAFTIDQRSGANQLCVVVANDRHGVLADSANTGNCVALPA